MIIDRAALSETQLQNLGAALQAYNNRSLVASARPVALFVELTRNCISRCRYCRKSWVNDPRYDMSRETFRRVLDDCAPHAAFVDVRSYGESLMLKDFPWHVEQLARVCLNLRVTTTLGCGDQEALRALVDHNVFVSVSFDAADKALYERYRVGINHDVVMRNLRFVSAEMLRKHGDLRGRMRIGIAPLYRDNLDHVDGVLELAHTLQIPEVRIVPLTSHWYDPNVLFYHQSKVLRVLHQAIDKAEAYGIELQFASPVLSSLRLPEKVCDRCPKPWFYANVLFDGTVRCCDWQIELEGSPDDLGNIRDGVEALWNGPIAQRIRQTHLDVRSSSALCGRCYRIGRYSDHEHDLDPAFRKWLVTGTAIKPSVTRLLHAPPGA